MIRDDQQAARIWSLTVAVAVLLRPSTAATTTTTTYTTTTTNAASNSFTIPVNPQSVSVNGLYFTLTPSSNGKVWATVTLDGAVNSANDIVIGDGAAGPGQPCSIIDPSPGTLIAGVQFEATFSGCNLNPLLTYDINVYISDNSGTGGTVSITDLVIPGSGSVTGDPVTYVGDQKVEFVLPQYGLTTLLETSELRVLAEPLPRDGRKEQWIGRVLVTTAGMKPQPVVEVRIKRLIGWFNRTAAHPEGFETIDVKMDWFMPGRPLRIMPPSDAVFNHPAGMDVVISRMRYTGYELDKRLPRREIVFVAGQSVKVAIFSSSANEYFGSSAEHAHLGTKFAHLDVEFFDMNGQRLMKGTLPELWGYQPLSEETRAMVKQPEEPSAEVDSLVKTPLEVQSSEDCLSQPGLGQGHAKA